ncbi:MAG: helix-turn-helix transcriptional regulator, partial [Muribaculaceae bacterium]|nr:helix-turn-helix transcriptional regulator [Muribaculaceae bacterium]
MNNLTLIHHDTKLSDIVIAEPTALTVLNRFGIYLGLGDLTVARACDNLGIDKDFLATILNTYLHESYFPERILASFKAATIVDYLGQTNNYYAQFQLPNIERHFNLLISKSNPDNNNLELML